MLQQERPEFSSHDEEIKKSADKFRIAREIAEEIGLHGDRKHAFALMTERGITEQRDRQQAAAYMRFEFDRMEADAQAQKFYAFLKETGRDGVIISDDDGKIIGDHSQEYIGEIEEDGATITSHKISMKGKIVGTNKIIAEEGFEENIFEPEPGVNVYSDVALENEMKNRKK